MGRHKGGESIKFVDDIADIQMNNDHVEEADKEEDLEIKVSVKLQTKPELNLDDIKNDLQKMQQNVSDIEYQESQEDSSQEERSPGSNQLPSDANQNMKEMSDKEETDSEQEEEDEEIENSKNNESADSID